MDDQRETQAENPTPRTSADESPAVAAAATVARMLANPRRVRRS